MAKQVRGETAAEAQRRLDIISLRQLKVAQPETRQMADGRAIKRFSVSERGGTAGCR